MEIIYEEKLGEITKEQAETIENSKTRELIKQFGLYNVRGDDIRTTEPLIKRFGYFYTKWDWEVLTTVVFLFLVIVVMFLFR